MKKPMQNILAQHSNKSIAYLCGRCGKEVEKEAIICPSCGASLGDIRCPFCNFRGNLEDFKRDTCPRCGRKKIAENKLMNKPIKNRSSSKPSLLTSGLFWFLFTVLTGAILLIVYLFIYFS